MSTTEHGSPTMSVNPIEPAVTSDTQQSTFRTSTVEFSGQGGEFFGIWRKFAPNNTFMAIPKLMVMPFVI